MEGIKTGVYQLNCGKLYVNKGTSTECFYDTNQELIVLKPGDVKFEALVANHKISPYYFSPGLINAQQDFFVVLAKKDIVKLLIKIDEIDKIGDFIFTSIIPKAYKEVFGDKVIIGMLVNDKCKDLCNRNKYVDYWYVNDASSYEPDIVLDLNNIEFKWGKKKADEEFGLKMRSSLVLDQLGLFLFNKTPVLDVFPGEVEFAEKNKPEATFPVIGVQLSASCKSRTLPQMMDIVNRLREKYCVILLDEKDDSGNYKYDISQLISLIYMCDIIVCPDSSVLHIAGALKKPIVGLFGHTDGKIIAEDYEHCSVVQGKCDEICWWKLNCLNGNSYQEKMDAGFTDCLRSITFEQIDNEITKILKSKKIFICMLTYNLLDWTKRAIESIRSWYQYKLFVVDNESTDGTVKWLEENGIDFVSKKQSVAAAQNVGIRRFLETDCGYFLLLNNDITLKRNTIDNLVSELESHEGVWGLSAKEVSVIPWEIDEASEIDSFEVIRDIPASAYSCTIFSRECIEKVGEFDERFAPRYIEDNDYTLRIRLLGHKFAQTGKSIFYHVLGGVIKSNDNEKKDRDVHWDTNIKLYIDKWGIHPHEPQILSKIDSKLLDVNTFVYHIQEMAKKGDFSVGIVRKMGGLGDHIFLSVLGKVIKKKFPMAEIVYMVPKKFACVYEFYPYIDKVVDDYNYKTDVSIECTDIDYKIEMIEMVKYGRIKSHRSKIYLEWIGIFDEDVSPEFYVSRDEKAWAINNWEAGGRKRIAVAKSASNKLKSWSGMNKLIGLLNKNDRYSVKVIDNIVGDSFEFSFREGASFISIADFVVSLDSAYSNVAGALGKPAVVIFGSRRGEVFKNMFPSFIPVQGKCTIVDRYGCDYNVDCINGDSYRDKEVLKSAECLNNLSPAFVYEIVEKEV